MAILGIILAIIFGVVGLAILTVTVGGALVLTHAGEIVACGLIIFGLVKLFQTLKK